MPRAVANGSRLYTPQITALQTLLRLALADDRIPPKVKTHIHGSVNFLVTALSNAQSGRTPLDGQIV